MKCLGIDCKNQVSYGFCDECIKKTTYIIEAQALIKIEVEANSIEEAEEKARQELEEYEEIDWGFLTYKKETEK